MRISDEDIECAIELYVNSIYDLNPLQSKGYGSGWNSATKDEWIDAVYEELVNEDINHEGRVDNRFDGKQKTIKRIIPILKKRLTELRDDEGYTVDAVEQF